MDDQRKPKTFDIHIGLDEPARYLIKVQGRLLDPLGDWFTGAVGCQYEAEAMGQVVTALEGLVADQAALHGLLNHIRDLGLTLLYVECLSARAVDF